MADVRALRARRERIVTEIHANEEVLRRYETRIMEAIQRSEAAGRDVSGLRAELERYRSEVRRLQTMLVDVDVAIRDAIQIERMRARQRSPPANWSGRP
jgi:chromosome segregation ATPase